MNVAIVFVLILTIFGGIEMAYESVRAMTWTPSAEWWPVEKVAADPRWNLQLWELEELISRGHVTCEERGGQRVISYVRHVQGGAAPHSETIYRIRKQAKQAEQPREFKSRLRGNGREVTFSEMVGLLNQEWPESPRMTVACLRRAVEELGLDCALVKEFDGTEYLSRAAFYSWAKTSQNLRKLYKLLVSMDAADEEIAFQQQEAEAKKRAALEEYQRVAQQ